MHSTTARTAAIRRAKGSFVRSAGGEVLQGRVLGRHRPNSLRREMRARLYTPFHRRQSNTVAASRRYSSARVVSQYWMDAIMVSWTHVFGLLLLSVAYAGSYTTPEGMQVTWNVTTTTVTVTLFMPSSLASSYEWWGIGFKTSGDRQDMVDSLLWEVTKSGTFYDVWSTDNNDPPQTTKGDAHLVSHISSNGAYTSVITRNLAGSDITLAAGSSYLLTYGYGPMSGSRLEKHSRDGGSTITLSNEYVATAGSTSATPSVMLGLGSLGLLCLALH